MDIEALKIISTLRKDIDGLQKQYNELLGSYSRLLEKYIDILEEQEKRKTEKVNNSNSNSKENSNILPRIASNETMQKIDAYFGARENCNGYHD
jgi:hypothetical protein